MKAVILAGGYGTRLSEYTSVIPKPMVEVGGHPLLWHIMNLYSSYGINDFIIALGYKASVIKDYFLNYYSLNSDFSVDLSTGQIEYHQSRKVNWKVTLIDTGIDTMTGGRVLRLKEFLKNDTFLLTYGDGVANVNIDNLTKFHKSHGKIATVTSVHPGARFGELDISDNIVKSFKEKPQITQGWINGGFFVFEPKFLDYITDDSSILEREPLETVAYEKELLAFQHEGFWQCMDTIRDKNYLEELWSSGHAPWVAKE